MRITLNGEACDVIASKLDEILIEQKYLGQKMATALNDEIVHKQDRANTKLKTGDRLEVVTPIGGG